MARHARARPSWRDTAYGPVTRIPVLRDWAAELAGLLHVPAPVLAYPAIPPAGAGTSASSARCLGDRAGEFHLSGPEPGCQGESPGGPRPGAGDHPVTADGRIRCGGTPAGACEDPAYVTAEVPGPGGACILGEVI